MDGLSLDDLSYLAAKDGLPQGRVLDMAKETVVRFKEAWRAERKHLPITSAALKAIEKRTATLPSVSEWTSPLDRVSTAW